MNAKAKLVVIAIMLVIVAIAVFYEFATAGRWLYAITFGVIVPIGTALEWRAARARGAGEIAEKFVAIVAAALLAAS